MEKDLNTYTRSLTNILFNKQNFILLGILILLCISGVFLFTISTQWERFKFGDPNEIGDAIGGITAPIINIFSAILIFSTIKLQIDTNEEQFNRLSKQIENQGKDRHFSIFNNELKDIETYYKDLTYEGDVSFSAVSKSMTHMLSMTKSQKNYGQAFNSFNNMIEARIYILTNLFSIISAIENKEFHESEHYLLSQKTLRFYNAHLKEHDEATLKYNILPYYDDKVKKITDLKTIITLIQYSDFYKTR